MLTADEARKAIQATKSKAHRVAKIMAHVEQGIQNAIIKLQTSFSVTLADEQGCDVEQEVLTQLDNLGYEARLEYNRGPLWDPYMPTTYQLVVSFGEPPVQKMSSISAPRNI